ncbi:YfdQ family protein [Pseudomonas sivasensis]|uniref:YfdQ family protein n=1 Tax=Pseudomonas sivasensis TaxID=1880678 RepID=UPI0030D7B52D
MQQALQHLVTLVQSLGKPIEVPGIPAPLALLPNGVSIESLEHLLPAPSRIKQKLTVIDAESFISYVNRFSTQATAVFCNGPEGRTFSAVIDYHDPVAPAWREHVATYRCPTTVEWGNWKEKDRKRMDQATFAEFIEDNVKDITHHPEHENTPSAADMLEISRTLEAKKNITFRQGTRLDNGQVQLTYNEEIDGRAGEAGQLRIPEEFFIALKPFLGGDAFCVPARFRYRIQEGRLVMWYELVRADKVLEEAYNAVRAKIEGAIKDVPLYEATI